jgi:hypothetical protein
LAHLAIHGSRRRHRGWRRHRRIAITTPTQHGLAIFGNQPQPAPVERV